MSANENFDLAVRLRGEGIDQTQSDLEETEEQFNETTESMSDSGDEAEGTASRWQGAMTGIVAGLAIASAGLLSRVPVIGGVMEGLNSIISAVAFQMDQVLRPILQPVADAFFSFSDAIFNAEGPLGTIIGVLGVLAVALGFVVAAALAATAATSVYAGLQTLYAGAVLVAQAAQWLLNAAIAFLPVVIFIAIAAIVVLIAIFIKKFPQIAEAVIGVLTSIITFLATWTAKFVSWYLGLYAKFFRFGVDIIQRFVDGIKSMASAPIDAVQGILDGITQVIGFDIRSNDRMAERWGKDAVEYVSGGMKKAQSSIPDNIIGGAGGSGSGGVAAPPTDSQPVVNLDGRKVSKNTRRQRGRERSSRGRHS